VKAWFAHQRYVPRQRYRAGFVLDPPASADRGSYVGRMLPGPRVRWRQEETHLDARLGAGFALIAIDAPEAQARHPLWARLEAKRIAIGAAPLGFERLDLLDARFDAARTRHRGEVLIVRPDRYVLGAVKPDALDKAAVQLGMHLSP
jgi:3-(3-hydroxy-phenyl)propionate hydroxylase